MAINQIKYNCNPTRYFEKDLESIVIDYIKAAGITVLPLAVRAMFQFMLGGTLKSAAEIFFSDRDIMITLVSIVSSAAFVSYKYLRHKPLCAVCWVCVALSFGVYLLTDKIDMYRGVMWFLICVIFSFANILASQYIPKERRNEIC